MNDIVPMAVLHTRHDLLEKSPSFVFCQLKINGITTAFMIQDSFFSLRIPLLKTERCKKALELFMQNKAKVAGR